MTETSNEYGRADEQGNVFLKTSQGEVKVGQYAAGDPAEGLAFFTKRFIDLKTEAELALKRLTDGKGSFDAINALVEKLKTTIANPNALGPIHELEEIAGKLGVALEEQKVVAAARKAQLKEAALKRREEIAELAQSLANSNAWKSTSEQFKNMLDEWKKLSSYDRAKEQELWKKFSAARSSFDKARRAHFANLDKVRGEANEAKNAIIKKATSLSESQEWAATTTAFKKLMDDWKKLPRAAKNEEEKLWKKFKEAQDKFFDARNAANSERDESLKGNLVVKEELAKLAEAILPVKNVETAKAALREIQEKWEKAGHVPRADRDKIERRLKKVEDEIRKHVEEIWRKSKPEVIERANSLVSSFENSLAKLEKQISDALAKGDDRKATDLKKQQAQTQALLDAAKSNQSDLN
ncbi:MAG: hypothetical protein RIS61_805 [Actinomycetota bacterium]|jgi:hypothetical protein